MTHVNDLDYDYLKPGDIIDGRYELRALLDDKSNARGGFAHVFRVEDLAQSRPAALKILWPRHTEVADQKQRNAWYYAFVREADVLLALSDDPRVVDLYDFGFMCSSIMSEANSVRRPDGKDAQAYRKMMAEASAQRWRPFLILELLEESNSLHRRINGHGSRIPTHRAGDSTQHRPSTALPMVEALDFTLQMVDFLVDLHAKRIIYYDGKPAHAYWDGHHIRLIDFNLSFRLDDPDLTSTGLIAKNAFATDVVIAARTFIYPAFVGLDWEKGNAPRSEGTQSASTPRNEAAMTWKGRVDLQGQEAFLDKTVVEFLQRAVKSEEFRDAESLRQATQMCAAALGWEINGHQPNFKARKALLAKREALDHLRQALDHFRKAEEALGQSTRAFASNDTEHLDLETRKVRKIFEQCGL